jgi:hypothetical protein
MEPLHSDMRIPAPVDGLDRRFRKAENQITELDSKLPPDVRALRGFYFSGTSRLQLAGSRSSDFLPLCVKPLDTLSNGCPYLHLSLASQAAISFANANLPRRVAIVNSGTGTVPRVAACRNAAGDGYPNTLLSAAPPIAGPYVALSSRSSSVANSISLLFTVSSPYAQSHIVPTQNRVGYRVN